MIKNILIMGLLVLFTFSLFAQDKYSEFEKNWPYWRGPYANGISPNGNPPIEWSEDKNIKWKIEVPGFGHATPIIWGNQMFVLTAIEQNKSSELVKTGQSSQQGRRRSRETKNVHKFVVLSINHQNGKITWQKTVKEEIPQDKTHSTGSWASNSSVTDGEHVYTYFGSRGLFCLDMKGNLKWERDFGQMKKRNEFGEGSSPVLYKNTIIVLWDHEEESFIIALDKNTGKNIWKVARDEGSTWSTPFIAELNGKSQIITVASNLVRSYNPDNGDLIWQCSGLTSNLIPMPVVANNIAYVMSGHRGSALLAINLLKAKGDISNSDAIIWQYNQDTPYTPSPLLVNNILYFLKSNNGILSCLNATNGEVYYSKKRLEGIGNVYSSLVSAQNRFYIASLKGNTFVIKQGSEFEILSQNKLDDSFSASPVVIDNSIYLRGNKYLYCISENE